MSKLFLKVRSKGLHLVRNSAILEVACNDEEIAEVLAKMLTALNDL